MTAAWLYLLFALIAGILAHFIAISKSPDKDCGDYWAQIFNRLALWLGLPLLLVTALHKFAFLTPYLPASPNGWLGTVAVAWAALLVLGLVRQGNSTEGRWLAGTLDFSPYRFWILILTVPFLPALFFTASPWSEDIYAAHWALLVAFLITLLGIAFSASPMSVWGGPERRPVSDTPPALSQWWPDEMRSRGITIENITSWDASVLPEPATGLAADWQRRLTAAGSPGVSAILCDAASRLLWMPQKTERLAVVLGPDWCGQEEVTALVATELSRRHGESTLIITSAPDPALSKRLSQWLEKLGGENPIQLADLSTDAGATIPGDLLVVDAETLSDVVLDQLRSELEQDQSGPASSQSVGRVGLVVWWDAQEFSGVLAAHVWAVSRRLERLLKSRRGPAARALVYARPPADREGLFLGFLEHLLPYPLKKENTFQIAADFARKTHLYRLGNESTRVVARATEASLLTEWPTLPPPDCALPTELIHLPAESAPAAGARILELHPAEVLSVRQMTCQGGRATQSNLDHHVAVARSDNPYIDFLVARYGNQTERGASVNLVSAEGHPELVRRHLLVALREVPDTLTGLRATFRWEEAMLRNTLLRLSSENRLSRVPVRFLDSDGRLQRDSRYTNQNPGQEAVRSFRTIGQRPVELRDPNVRNRLLMQVDPERLTIDAYPKKVIASQGRRYRVQSWPNDAPSRIDCLPEEPQIRTWRFSIPRVDSLERTTESLIFRGVARYTARVQYHEHVTGVLERNPDGVFHTIGIDRVKTHFRTEAVILEFTDAFPPDCLISAAAALRHVLPVHLAVEESAMEVVPLTIGNRQGLALVDLYPGGIGVVNAIHKTVWLVPMLFDQVGLWLSGASDDASLAALSRSPLVRTMGIDRLNLKGALRVFTSAGWQAK